MWSWIRSLLGKDVPTVINELSKENSTPKKATKPKTKAKKAATKTCDFSKLTKDQLLKEAKKRGVKANASLTKAELVKRLG
jgi:hypothetical protein